MTLIDLYFFEEIYSKIVVLKLNNQAQRTCFYCIISFQTFIIYYSQPPNRIRFLINKARENGTHLEDELKAEYLRRTNEGSQDRFFSVYS